MGCNNSSPVASHRDYSAEEYLPWLDELCRRKIPFEELSVMGGEPFLHSDLAHFVQTLKMRYRKRMMLSSNGFWLSDAGIRYHRDLLMLTDVLFISRYPNIAKEVGGNDAFEYWVNELRRCHPHLHVDVRAMEHSWRELSYTSEPLIVNKHCFNAECTNLLADGRMARCGPGAYAHLDHSICPEFTGSNDMFYDLKTDNSDFWMWRKRWPLDACKHCTHFKATTVRWKVLPGAPRHREYEVEYHRRMIANAASQGRFEQATEITTDALRRFPDEASLFSDLGLLRLLDGDYVEAKGWLLKALHLDGACREALQNYALLITKYRPDIQSNGG